MGSRLPIGPAPGAVQGGRGIGRAGVGSGGSVGGRAAARAPVPGCRRRLQPAPAACRWRAGGLRQRIDRGRALAPARPHAVTPAGPPARGSPAFPSPDPLLPGLRAHGAPLTRRGPLVDSSVSKNREISGGSAVSRSIERTRRPAASDRPGDASARPGGRCRSPRRGLGAGSPGRRRARAGSEGAGSLALAVPWQSHSRGARSLGGGRRWTPRHSPCTLHGWRGLPLRFGGEVRGAGGRCAPRAGGDAGLREEAREGRSGETGRAAGCRQGTEERAR